MSEPVDPVSALIGMAQQAGEGMRRAEAAMLEASRPPRFEYQLVRWGYVNEAAREGWRLVPIGPIIGVYEDECPPGGFVMQRQLGAADEAADMLKRTEAGPCYGENCDHVSHARKEGS